MSGIINHFTSNGSSSQKRDALEFEQLLRRAQAEEDESGAISLSTIASIASFAAPVVSGIIDHFTSSSSSQQQRDFVEMIARQAQDDSEALSFSDIKNIGSIAFHVGDAVKDIFSRYAHSPLSFLVT